jgi:hypothetical protein
VDKRENVPGVVPEALERKWPKAGEKFIWFWFWPSRNLLRDHRSGIVRRHHVLDVTFQKAIREAVERAGFDKGVSGSSLKIRNRVDVAGGLCSVTGHGEKTADTG